ncbi:MAG: hypothetical protein MOP51_3155 [Citricoccus sp.]|nr:hypothetical protein [Citricoccus sp. WCRC_4]
MVVPHNAPSPERTTGRGLRDDVRGVAAFVDVDCGCVRRGFALWDGLSGVLLGSTDGREPDQRWSGEPAPQGVHCQGQGVPRTICGEADDETRRIMGVPDRCSAPERPEGLAAVLGRFRPPCDRCLDNVRHHLGRLPVRSRRMRANPVLGRVSFSGPSVVPGDAAGRRLGGFGAEMSPLASRHRKGGGSGGQSQPGWLPGTAWCPGRPAGCGRAGHR